MSEINDRELTNMTDVARCISNELLQTGFELSQYGNYMIDKNDIENTAKKSLGIEMNEDLLQAVHICLMTSLMANDSILDYQWDEETGEYDFMIGYNRILDGGVYFFDSEEDSEKQYDEFVKGFHYFEKKFPMNYDFCAKKLYRPLGKEYGFTKALTEKEARKKYQDLVVNEILDDHGKIKNSCWKELIDTENYYRKEANEYLQYWIDQDVQEWANGEVTHFHIEDRINFDSYNDRNLKYILLGKLKAQNDNYLNGDYDKKKLWGGTIEQQNKLMKCLYLSIDGEKPLWITLSDITKYQEKMSNVEFNRDLDRFIEDLVDLTKEAYPYEWKDNDLDDGENVEKMMNEIKEEFIGLKSPKNIVEYVCDPFLDENEPAYKFEQEYLVEPFEDCSKEIHDKASPFKWRLEELYLRKEDYLIVEFKPVFEFDQKEKIQEKSYDESEIEEELEQDDELSL